MSELRELRVTISADILATMDACHHVNPEMTRTAIVEQVLRDWVEQRKRESIVICRINQINPLAIPLADMY